MLCMLVIATLVFTVGLYLGSTLWGFIASSAVFMVMWASSLGMFVPEADVSWVAYTGFYLTAIVLGGLMLLFGLPAMRRVYLSKTLMKIMASLLPKISDTEKIALDAGTVWWDAELFSGRPN